MTNKRYYNFLIFACAFLWIMMLGSKNVYTAELSVVMEVFKVSRAEASLAMNYYFVIYSITQIILFFIMKRINIKWYMLCCVLFSGIITVLVAFMTNMWHLSWLLALNGILQAGGWGMCIAVIKKYLPANMLPKANAIMNIGMAIGGIISYAFSAIFVSLGLWNLPFIILGVILAFSGVLFFIAVHLCQKHTSEKNQISVKENESENQNSFDDAIFKLTSPTRKFFFYILTFLLSFFVHYVYYGALNWMPNFLTGVFGLEQSVGILIATLAPIATIAGPIIAIYHCEKVKNYISVTTLYMGLGLLLCTLLIFIFEFNIIISCLVLILFLVFAQIVITIIFSVLSFKMSYFIDTGTHSCLMNAAGGFAAGFAPTLTGLVIDGAGWQISYAVLSAICLLVIATLVIVNLSMNKRKIKSFNK